MEDPLRNQGVQAVQERMRSFEPVERARDADVRIGRVLPLGVVGACCPRPAQQMSKMETNTWEVGMGFKRGA